MTDRWSWGYKKGFRPFALLAIIIFILLGIYTFFRISPYCSEISYPAIPMVKVSDTTSAYVYHNGQYKKAMIIHIYLIKKEK